MADASSFMSSASSTGFSFGTYSFPLRMHLRAPGGLPLVTGGGGGPG